MKHLCLKKQAGFILTSELLLISTVVLGLALGTAAVRNSVLAEMDDYAGAVGGLNQSIDYASIQNATAGSHYQDQIDNSHTGHYVAGSDLIYFDAISTASEAALK